MVAAEDGSEGPVRTVKEMLWEGKGKVELVTLKWLATAIADGVAPDAPNATKVFDIGGAKAVLYQVDTMHITGGWAGTVDVHVLSSADGVVWDTVDLDTPATALAEQLVQSLAGKLGAYYVKVTMDINGANIPAGEYAQVHVRVVSGM